MSDFPEKQLLQKVMPWLLEVKRRRVPPFITADELSQEFLLDSEQLQNLNRWMLELKVWTPIGTHRYQVTEFVEGFDRQYRVSTEHLDFHLLHRFATEQQTAFIQRLAMQVIAAKRKRQDTKLPLISIGTILEFSGDTPDGRLVKAVAAPWYDLIRLFERGSNAFYDMDPFKFEEIVAGAWQRTGEFDEVILTKRSGDLGRDIIAVKNGVGSIRIYDQVKRYGRDQVVSANDVRALAGVIARDQNVSKGIITTTADFAPGVRKEYENMIPYRLELRSGADLLEWLIELAKNDASGS